VQFTFPRRTRLSVPRGMTTYAIGDLQGCFEPLQRLLDRLGFDERRDRLWFTGDLVNRGPDSLATLRFVHALGDAATVVLGNHDLHLLAVAEGLAKLRRDDTLDEVLDSPDREMLLDWLRHRPLMHFEDGYAIVHAGLLPEWSISRALELAVEAQAALQAPNYRSFLAKMYGNKPARWSEELSGFDRLRVVINAMTRLRVCTLDGAMEFSHKGPPKRLPAGYVPWFEVPARRSRDTPVIFGHWSGLGRVSVPNLFALDTGCLWGRRLSALRLEDQKLFQTSCRARAGAGRAR
jgi:bis(5'-nucleosyl)-tetraphosphatase (symmetrical)